MFVFGEDQSVSIVYNFAVVLSDPIQSTSAGVLTSHKIYLIETQFFDTNTRNTINQQATMMNCKYHETAHFVTLISADKVASAKPAGYQEH
jgi:hypothetical protein